jgi:amino acid adenylation domain-containing protein
MEYGAMLNSTEASDARRVLLEKYLRGDLKQGATGAKTIKPHNRNGHIPLSSGQQQLWLLAQLIPDTPVYNECVTIRIPGRLDAAALERSLNEFIRRHEICRTTFPVVDGMPVQLISPSLMLTLPLIDLRDLPEDERKAKAHRIMMEKTSALFDLSAGPLLRPILLRLGDEEHHLFISLHHIIFDGVALYQVFLPELNAIYEAFAAGQPSPLAEPSIQYADYASWQREWLQTERIAAQLDYWKKQLAGAPAGLELPTDRSRPAAQSYQGAMRPFTLSKHLTGVLKAVSQQEGVTFYMTLVAAFQTLLFRYTGQDDMLTGTASAGRKLPEVQRMMGFFLNTLVLRTSLSGNPTFRELLMRVRDVTLAAMAHQDVPFEYLVKELQPERNLNTNPFFQTLLTFVPPQPVLPSGWTLTQMDAHAGTAKFDLYLEVDDTPGGLVGRFMYNTDLFEAATIDRMAEHWQILLEGIARDLQQRIADLPLLSEQEQHRVLVEWNNTRTTYPAHEAVYRLFEAQVARAPEAVALIYEDRAITYRELNRRANQLAHHLRALGVVSESVVGICMDRSPELIVSMLAILKAGGAYLPLDPSYPVDRLAFMLQDTGATVLIAQKHYLDLFAAQSLHLIGLDAGWHAIEHEPEENLPGETGGDSLAYLMYTSGSTGRPKGVEIRHRSINRLVFGVDYARLDDTCTLMHMAAISFDASTLEVWGALLHGARCVLYPERIPTPKNMKALIRKYHVTTLWLTASLFNAIIDEDPYTLSGAQQVMTGGEALSVAHISRASRALPSTEFINGYGPTETTTFACCYSIPRAVDETWRSIPIGRPIGNTSIYILDRHMQPAPIGVPGELHIGGAGLARGYLNRPELTSARFVANPFSDDPEARLYKTGDLVRYLPDGNIEFIGRIDQQVKIRGFRIEPGEIETALGQHPSVLETLVVARENTHKEKYLLAYVVPRHEHTPTENELRRFLKRSLPEYMIPSRFIQLKSFPLTPNGKIDWQALPAPDVDSDMTIDSYIAPTSVTEYQLIAIWEELLKRQHIGIRDNFFYLGGHSLLAALLVDRIEQSFGKKIPLATLFAGPTIEQLANALQQEETTQSRVSLVIVQKGNRKQPFFYLHGDYMGGAFYCYNLARSLGPDQPFYALDPYQFIDQRVVPTLEKMAAEHLQVMRTVQPEGPYLLGGFCNGGLMAYEMARQLRAAGQEVAFLVLIDPASPPHSAVTSFINRLCSLLRKGQDKQLDWFLRVRHIYKYLRFPDYRRGLVDTEGVSTQHTSNEDRSKGDSSRSGLKTLFPDVETLRQDWPGIYRWIASGYASPTYSGNVTFVWSSKNSLFKKAWRRTMPVVIEDETQVISGTHLINTPEQIASLADYLRKRLQ